ncbi:MAG: ABC transporter ATP-binding protein, partial [Erysipelotrichaceae bacterium]
GCLDKASSGEYLLNGIHIHEYAANQLADIRNQQIGFVFQQFNLIPTLTTLENVELPMVYAKVKPNQRKKNAKDVLEQVGLQDRMLNLPTQLSGGQQQRVSIARSLVNNPAIILADEPTGALDSSTSKEIIALLRLLHEQGRTIVIITHDPEVAKMCERIVAIKDGLIVEDRVNEVQV